MNKLVIFFITFIVIPVVIFLVSYLHIYPQFSGEFTQQFGSIEVSYISMADFILDSYPNISWQPLWYFGYPFYLIYLPVVVYIEVIAKILFGSTPSHTYRFLTALSYCLTPVSLYFLVYIVTKKRIAACFSGLFYSVVPSVFAYLFNSVAQDRFASGFIEPRRFTILVRWGEGPHTVGLVFLPLAAAFFYQYLRYGKLRYLILTAVFIGLTSLTNAVAVWGLAVLLFAIVVEKILKNSKSELSIIIRALTVLIVTYGCIAFWYNLSFINTFFGEGGGVVSYWIGLFPWGLLGIIIGFIVFVLILKKTTKKYILLTASLIWFIIIFGFVYIYYSSGDDRIELVPQVLRLNTEADMALSLVLGLILGYLLEFLWKKTILFKSISIFIIVVVFGLLIQREILISQELPKFAIPVEETNKVITSIPEYKVSQNLQKLSGGDKRVFAPGNYGFFLNYFTKVPQIRGALFQSSIHPWPDHIYYQITSGESAKISLNWLKISNISYLVYTTAGSGELYKDFKVKRDKFDKMLKVEKEEGGDIYYKVELKDDSLAKVVPLEISNVPVPFNAIDEKPIQQYVSLLEKNPGKATIKQVNNDKYIIEADVASNEVILFQMSYHKGWKAKNENGKTLTVYPDPLGFILINPKKTGHVVINLSHHPILSQYIGIATSIITFIILIYLFLLPYARKKTI